MKGKHTDVLPPPRSGQVPPRLRSPVVLPALMAAEGAAFAVLAGLDGSPVWRVVRVLVVIAVTALAVWFTRRAGRTGQGAAALVLGIAGTAAGVGGVERGDVAGGADHRLPDLPLADHRPAAAGDRGVRGLERAAGGFHRGQPRQGVGRTAGRQRQRGIGRAQTRCPRPAPGAPGDPHRAEQGGQQPAVAGLHRVRVIPSAPVAGARWSRAACSSRAARRSR